MAQKSFAYRILEAIALVVVLVLGIVGGSIYYVRSTMPAATNAESKQAPKLELPGLQMKIDGGARFARPWRVWMKKT